MNKASPRTSGKATRRGWLDPAGAPWRSVAESYIIYVSCFLAGSFLQLPGLNAVGAGLSTVWLGLRFSNRLLVIPREPLLIPLVLLLLLLPVPLLYSPRIGPDFVATGVKMSCLLTLAGLALIRRLPAIYESRSRFILLGAVVLVLVLSLVLSGPGEGKLEGRVSGLLVNPNNLALTAMLLFCLVHPGDRPWLYWGAQAFALLVIFASGTSGALAACAVGLAWGVYQRQRRHLRWGLIALLGMAVVLGGPLLLETKFLSDSGVPQLARLSQQIDLVRSNARDIWQGSEFDYYQSEAAYGAGSTSGVWRVAHWGRVIREFALSDWPQIAFGAGADAAEFRFGILPHNDYLRVLFDGGVVGLACWLWIAVGAWRRATNPVRPAMAMVGFYCLTENNIDNFLFMSLFMVCMFAGLRRPGHSLARVQERARPGRRPGLGLPSLS